VEDGRLAAARGAPPTSAERKSEARGV
jgi:hypothetical protein